MEPSSFSTNRTFRQWRRHRAWELFQQGWKQKDIAVALAVTEGAVSQWITRAKTGGVDALKERKAPGGISKMTSEQKAQLPALLTRGAEAFGFCGDAWTCERIAEVIAGAFAVTYSPNHVRVVLRECGWSYQTPTCRATQRKEDAIAHWKQERLPHLKKGQR
jgi:transposase